MKIIFSFTSSVFAPISLNHRGNLLHLFVYGFLSIPFRVFNVWCVASFRLMIFPVANVSVCLCWCLDDSFSNRNGNDGNRYQCLCPFVSAVDDDKKTGARTCGPSSNANRKTPTERGLQQDGQTIFNSNKSSLKLFWGEKSRAIAHNYNRTVEDGC